MATFFRLVVWLVLIAGVVLLIERWSRNTSKKSRKRTIDDGVLIIRNRSRQEESNHNGYNFCTLIQKIYFSVTEYSSICYNYLPDITYCEKIKKYLAEISFRSTPEQVREITNRWEEFHKQNILLIPEIGRQRLEEINNDLHYSLESLIDILNR